MVKQTIAQGAEALLIKTSPTTLVKDRVPKSYRLPFLDQKIRKSRTRRETKILTKASSLIPVPKLISSDDIEKIEMEFIPGKKLSDNLDTLTNAFSICKKIGKQISILHDNNIIHGDLTTSNMILSNTKPQKLYFIDFGLSFTSHRPEDKAVDLHLIKQALEAKHFKHFKTFFKAVIEGYKSSPNSSIVLKQLEKVEARGRYKQQY
jgi:Kae1-associated kinase Bud32